ncbi:pyruvoyl-dependent arginine decarboxylase [Methanobacterium spitsbergense]|uniref:Pyruvoyl-dependent arginine decarboxylase n=1 Tax=Methanobacterium spitsbergense TaxID=2874285 RepID=A0A8T5UXC0_9EURY|nr:arginine decarboxylase, pyruvoyl-dependent [Methanobacterium spitsbergense]MBZ2165339.1 arginine decarboxylase, pyruvoyl-dependent [Methanobacterium spitsbergense]
MKVSITSGRAEGPTKLNAFDNALLDANIGNVNLIKVSSILPSGTEVVPIPKFPAGDMVNCVLAYTSSDVEGDLITAVVAAATSDDFGCVVENTGVNRDLEDVKSEAKSMVQYMMDIRGLKIKEMLMADETHIVKKQGAVVAAVVYIG